MFDLSPGGEEVSVAYRANWTCPSLVSWVCLCSHTVSPQGRAERSLEGSKPLNCLGDPFWYVGTKKNTNFHRTQEDKRLVKVVVLHSPLVTQILRAGRKGALSCQPLPQPFSRSRAWSPWVGQFPGKAHLPLPAVKLRPLRAPGNPCSGSSFCCEAFE